MEELNIPEQFIYANEEEVMLARNLVYRFKNHIETSKYDILEMDIVLDKLPTAEVHQFWEELPKRYWKKNI